MAVLRKPAQVVSISRPSRIICEHISRFSLIYSEQDSVPISRTAVDDLKMRYWG